MPQRGDGAHGEARQFFHKWCPGERDLFVANRAGGIDEGWRRVKHSAQNNILKKKDVGCHRWQGNERALACLLARACGRHRLVSERRDTRHASSAVQPQQPKNNKWKKMRLAWIHRTLVVSPQALIRFAVEQGGMGKPDGALDLPRPLLTPASLQRKVCMFI